MVRRRVRVFTSPWILEEVRRSALKVQRQKPVPERDPWPVINWFADSAQLVEPSPVGKQRSRDAKDDPVLGTALTSSAQIIVTLDKDFLVLEKPFGIEIIRPRRFLARIQMGVG